MTESPVPGPSMAAGYASAAMLDAGGEPWEIVGSLVTRRLADLRSGDVLEIVSMNPDHRLDILSWCRGSDSEYSHDLFQMVVDGDRTWFWIKKR